MNSTALGATAEKEGKIIFISDAHEKFYYEKLKEVRYQDVYHKALCYCLGICNDTRENAYRIYDFKTGNVKTECLHEGWQTSGSQKVVRMAFNLYCNGTPSVYEELEEGNYNMVDNVLNNGVEKKEQERMAGRISIREKLAEKKAAIEHKDKTVQKDQDRKTQREM